MAKCNTCGNNAGWFKSECISCKTIRKENEEKIKEEQRILYEKLKSKKIERKNIINNWIDNVINFTSDHLLDENEEKILLDYRQKYDISDDEITEVNKFVLSFFELYIELREYLNKNKLPVYDKSDFIGFNFMKTEAPFLSITLPFYEEKKITTRKARSDGYSVRIMKGFWVRQTFHNPTIQKEEMILQDIGMFVLTNKHIYFKGKNKIFRYRLDKLIEITPYKNGIQLMKDGVSSKPQFFGILDGVNLGEDECPKQFEQFCSVCCHVAIILSGNM